MKLVSGHKRSGRTRLCINRCMLDDNGLLVVSDEAHRAYAMRILRSEHGMSELDARIRIATFWEVFAGMHVTKKNLYIDDLDNALKKVSSFKGAVIMATIEVDSLEDLSTKVREKTNENNDQRKEPDSNSIEQRSEVGSVRHTTMESAQESDCQTNQSEARPEPSEVASETRERDVSTTVEGQDDSQVVL